MRDDNRRDRDLTSLRTLPLPSVGEMPCTTRPRPCLGPGSPSVTTSPPNQTALEVRDCLNHQGATVTFKGGKAGERTVQTPGEGVRLRSDLKS